MNKDSGYSAYENSLNLSDDSRDVEYRLLAQVTSALIKAKDNPGDVKLVMEAAMWNRDVWSALRVDLTDDNNRLPQELRASLISLSLWIERETQSVMGSEGDIDALIEVNKNIMAGLKPEMAQEIDETSSNIDLDQI